MDSYITSDSGDAGFFDSMTWLAGATPFETSKDGGTVTINLTGDKNVKTFTDFWQKMIDEDLIDTKTVGWTDDWNKGLDDGSIASLLTGAWMPYNLLSGAPNGDGKWRIARCRPQTAPRPTPRTVVPSAGHREVRRQGQGRRRLQVHGIRLPRRRGHQDPC